MLAEVCKPVLLRWRASSSPLTEGIICWFSCLHVWFSIGSGEPRAWPQSHESRLDPAREPERQRAPPSQHAPASRARGQEADGRSHSLLSGFLKLAAPVDPGSDRSRKRPRTARGAAIPRLSRGRAWRRCRAGPSDYAAGMLSADNQMHALPTQSHNSRVGGHALRTSTTTPGSRWKAVVPSTSAYGHGPRPSPCLLSRSRPCLLVAFTTHRTSAVARGPDPRRTAAATNAKHDRRLTV